MTKSIPPRQEPETAKLIEALKPKIRGAIWAAHHDSGALGWLDEAANEVVALLSTALARSQAAPMPTEEEIVRLLMEKLYIEDFIGNRAWLATAARAILDRLSIREDKEDGASTPRQAWVSAVRD